MLNLCVSSRRSSKCSEVNNTDNDNDHQTYVAIPARVAGGTSEAVYDPKIPAAQQKVTYQAKDGTLKTVTKAELQEQLETGEKLMQGLNETWEEKMQRTQAIQQEREKALEELGISVEKNNVGVHTPKRVRTSHSVDLGHSSHLFHLDVPSRELGMSPMLYILKKILKQQF